MDLEKAYWTVQHEGGWETIAQKHRPPFIVSIWMKFEGKFRSKQEAKVYEKELRANPKYNTDKLFAVCIDKKKALENFQREWELPDHGIYGKT